MTFYQWLRKNAPTVLVLTLAAILFFIAWGWAKPEPEPQTGAEEYAQYERAQVMQILTENIEEVSLLTNEAPARGEEVAYRGTQTIIVEVTSGQYEGQQMLVEHFVGPLTSPPLSVGDSTVVNISTYKDGSTTATVYEYDRLVPIVILVVLFLAAAIAVGGRTGIKSLVGLTITLLCLFGILIPALMKGAPTLLTVFLTCAFIACVSLTILGGIQKKTLCAMAATVTGTAMALLFGLLAQWLLRLDGLRGDEVEALLNLNRDGVPIRVKGLLIGGIIIGSLGAVMDVTMGICSAMQEVHQADPQCSGKQLFKSGMNVGKDMVGTMTTTLVLAILGSSFTTILYIYSMGLQPMQLLSSPFFSNELLSSIATSIGVIFSIPLTALICAAVYTRKKR